MRETYNNADLKIPTPPPGFRQMSPNELRGNVDLLWDIEQGWGAIHSLANPTEKIGGLVAASRLIQGNIITGPINPVFTVPPAVPAEAIAHGAPPPKTSDAADATLTARAAMYGTFAQNSKVAQGLKAILAGAIVEREDALPDDLTEALDMACSKMARIVNGSPEAWHDSLLDLEGFFRLVRERMEGNPR